MIVLGIESSCDETGIALFDSEQGELAHHVFSQIELHQIYGGVVPELASRDHINRIIELIDACLLDAKLTRNQIDVIAYTAGPGLLGALMCGASVAQSLAMSLDIPSVAIHHMEGHLLAALLDADHPPVFPFVGLLVSGGHTMLILVKEIGDYQILGESLDDAVGEAFDKTAKLLGLDYPGGPELAKLAEKGDPSQLKLTRPMVNRPGLDFSFSGLKTQVRLAIESGEYSKEDIAASFQKTVVDTLLIKCQRAIKQTKVKSLLIAGGVASNTSLRSAMQKMCDQQLVSLHVPATELCTDNGLMIAHVGAIRALDAKKDYAIHCYSRKSLESLQVSVTEQ